MARRLSLSGSLPDFISDINVKMYKTEYLKLLFYHIRKTFLSKVGTISYLGFQPPYNQDLEVNPRWMKKQ